MPIILILMLTGQPRFIIDREGQVGVQARVWLENSGELVVLRRDSNPFREMARKEELMWRVITRQEEGVGLKALARLPPNSRGGWSTASESLSLATIELEHKQRGRNDREAAGLPRSTLTSR